MKNMCTYCGAMIEEGSKICTNCGRVVPVRNTAKKQGGQFNNFDDRADTSKRTGEQNSPNVNAQVTAQSAARRQQREQADLSANTRRTNPPRRQEISGYDPVKQAKQEKIPFVTNASSGKENRSKIVPIVSMLVKIIIVAAILYVGFAFLRCYLVSSKGYDFKLDENMKLSCETYGEAVDNFFEEGKWRYHISDNKVVYYGTTKEGEEYVMTFGKENGDTVVKRLTIDGKKIDDDKVMELYVMQMFMAESPKE